MTSSESRRGPKNVSQFQGAFNKFLAVPKHFRKDEERVNNAIGFSPFDNAQSKKASNLASEFMKIADQNKDDPIQKVMDAANEKTKTEDPELVRWALMIFVTHHPAARSRHIRIPSLIRRAPQITVPKKFDLSPGPFIGDTKPPPKEEGGDIEQVLNWWREDPNFNEHHEHFHIVYPGSGITINDQTVLKDRQGELFIYMHRQVLARYDAERHASGIPLVNPLKNLDEPIPEGYNPNDNLVDSDQTPFSTRKPNSKLSDMGDGMRISDLKQTENRIREAIKASKFYDGSNITPDLLGKVIESSTTGKGDEFEYYYGSLHNVGHVLISYINDPANANSSGNDPGVMYNPRTAARDPVFWRWHRHIDDVYNEWIETLKPNDFSDSPPVKIRAGDLILSFKDKLSINNGPTQDEEALKFGMENFGGPNFDSDLTGNQFVTKELQTKMKTRKWTWVEDSGKTTDIDYLYPREFYYYIRVENTSSSIQNITVRIFLAPEDLANSPRHWIELDKFKHELPAQSKQVICRDCDMSSVVRQPPQKTEDELDDTTTPPGKREDLAEQYCDCGWPFHLLLPRGRRDGMKFKLLVFITDWNKDKVPTLSRCGSISFCGAERPGDKYPDARPMGYPFDRPFKNGSYEQTFSGLNNATITDITIKWVDDFPEIKVTA